MTLEFVSEVDRRFLANNLLTKEDWDASLSDPCSSDPAMEEGIGDLSDFLDLNEELRSFTDNLPDELMNYNNDSTQLADTLLNDYWNDFGDGATDLYAGVEVKKEPLSPASSNCSETGSEGYGSSSEVSSSLQSLPTDIKIEEVPSTRTSPMLSGSTTLPVSTANRVYTIIPKQEDKTIILNNVNGNSVGVLTPVTDGVVRLNHIMNSKIKIQPKPCDAPVKVTKPVVQNVSPTPKPLVLTPEEFSKLTSSGTLCFQPPRHQSAKPVAMDTSEPIIPSANTFDSSDIKNVKRQQRMIKNRESASLSRKRKKEYLSTLEAKLNNFNTENQKLKQENDTLKKKICALQTENDRLKQQRTVLPINRKATTCLFAILVLLSINIAPWSLLNESPKTLEVAPVHKGRQLMSVSDKSEDSSLYNRKEWSSTADLLIRRLHRLTEEMEGHSLTSNQSDVNQLMCPSYFNKTESMLLAEQLAGWMIRHEEEKQKTEQKKMTGKKKVKKLHAALRGDMDAFKHSQRFEDNSYQVQLFSGADNRQDFLNAIHRRNDTFYVLSFNQDYFLVPATAHNKTMRPRMSLVMPAVSLNETMQPPEGSIGMMQIDCEVVSTQLIHVHKSVIPPHHRRNSTYNKYRSKSRDHYP